MNKLLNTLIIILAALAAYFLCSQIAQAGELEYLGFDVSQYTGELRDPQLDRGTETEGQTYSYRASLDHRYRLYQTGEFKVYWVSSLRGKGNDAQFRYVGWDTGVYFKVERLEFYYHHLSEHLMDSSYTGPTDFPLSNRVGVNIILFGGK
jgi:hypothetical protein